MKAELSRTTATKKDQIPVSKAEHLINTSEQIRPLSRKAQEMKIFLERNPIPKEFLKS